MLVSEYDQKIITTLVQRAVDSWYGYKTKGDAIQFLSETLDIPENIAEWMINYYVQLQNE